MKDLNKQKKVAIAMSGGVDSSVAAYLLLKQGFKVTGFFMKFWADSQDDTKKLNKCCSVDSFMQAQLICSKLGIKLYTLNFQELFKQKVVDDFIYKYKIGKTPNPCVFCNQFVKLGGFWKKVKQMGFDFISSGHYADLYCEQKFCTLKIPKDKTKDQTYFLYRLDQDTLRHLIFPLANYKKDEVKQIAFKNLGISFKKKESQEVCFVPNKLKDFLQKHMSFKKGPIIDIITNKILGEHQGLFNFTIGQRKGLGLAQGPWFVVKKDLYKNILYVTNNKSVLEIQNKNIQLEKVFWTIGFEPNLPLEVKVKIRYKQKFKTAVLFKKDKDLILNFKEKVFAPTPGQSAVFYKDDLLLGGGIIV